ESPAVFAGLDFDCDEGNSLLLGLDDSGGVAVDVEEVVGETVAGGEWELTDSAAAASFDIDAIAILNEPAGGGKQAVDVSAGAVLGPAPGWDGHGRSQRISQDSAAWARRARPGAAGGLTIRRTQRVPLKICPTK